MQKTMIKTRDQARAAFVWQRLEGLGGELKEYGKASKGAPALVMSNGLMQTVGYYQNKSQAGKRLVEHLAEWLELCGQSKEKGFKGLMTSLHRASAMEYMQATDESLELLKWIRQLAAAFGKESGA